MKIYDINGNELDFIKLVTDFIESKSTEHSIDINNVMLGVCDEHGGLITTGSPNIEIMELGEFCFDGYNINSIEVINDNPKLFSKSDVFRLKLSEFEKLSRQVGYLNGQVNVNPKDEALISEYEQMREQQLDMMEEILALT